MSLQDDRTGIPSARLMNRLVEWSRRSFRLALGVGLRMQHTPAGRALALDGPDRSFPARLITGEGSGPFVFRRVRRKAGAWVDVVARDDRAVAYQANSLTVGIPRVVTLRNVGLPSEYRFWLPRDEASSGGGMETSPCFPCAIPRVDLYLTLLRGGFYASGSPDQDLEPLEIPLTYLTAHSYFTVANPDPIIGGRVPVSEATPVWASTCVAIPSLQTVVAEDGSSTVETTSTYYRLWIYCHPVDGVMVEGWKYTDDDTDCDDTAPETFLLFPSLRFTLLATCAASCIPLKLYLSSVIGETVLTTAPGDLEITTTIDFRPIVTRLECEGVSDPVAGATVTIQRHGSLSPEATGTTGSDGRPTTTDGRLTVTRAGRYTVQATLDDCVVEEEVIVTECDETVEVPIVICCAAIVVPVEDVDGPLVEAVVQAVGEEFITDALGQVTIPLSTRQVQDLPLDEDGCTPLLRVTALASNHLTRCVDVPVTCGSDTSPTTATPVFLERIAPDYARWEACPDEGCLVGGINNRGMIPAELLGALTPEAKDDGGSWYALLGSGLSGVPQVYTLNDALMSGNYSGYNGPFPIPMDSAPVLEWEWSGFCSVVIPVTDCVEAYTQARIFIRQKKIVAWLTRPDTTSSFPDAIVPPNGPVCAVEPGGTPDGKWLELDMGPLDPESSPFDFCIPFAIDQTRTITGGAGGNDYRDRIQILPR